MEKKSWRVISLGVGAFLIGAGITYVHMAQRKPLVHTEYVPQRVEVAKVVPVQKSTQERKPYCKLDVTGDVAGAATGWVRYLNAEHCFSIDRPLGWKVYSQGGAVQLYSPRNMDFRAPNELSLGDVQVHLLPTDWSQETRGDEQERYALERHGGKKEVRKGFLMGEWGDVTYGDGSALSNAAADALDFAGRGVYQIELVQQADRAVDHAMLEKIAQTFQAQ